MRKIIASGKCWSCANMDNLAPITAEGTEYLLSDDKRIIIWDDDFSDDNKLKIELIKSLDRATLDEKQNYARRKRNMIFKGDTVIIKRGRKMVGETKVVKGYSRFDVEGTYGHAYTEYLLFTDGTKVNINHCDVVGIEYEHDFYNGKEFFFRYYAEEFNVLSLSVGGRL